MRSSVQGDWQPVVCQGMNVFVFSGYLDYEGSGGGCDDGGRRESPTPRWCPGHCGRIRHNRNGVRLRSSASLNGAIVMVVSEGQEVSVVNGSTGDSVAVSYRGTSGYIHM